MADQMTPEVAAAKLETLRGDAEWSKGFLAGDGPKVTEFNSLMAAAHPDQKSREVEMAIAGQLFEGLAGQPSGHLANVAVAQGLQAAGISADVIRQALTGGTVSQAEHDVAAKQKAALMRDHEFAQKFLAKNGPQVEQMTLLNVILSSPIKAEKTA